ncbi:hydroxymethylglutaryl-CoA lyase, mitochondrial [Cephus cinctus]|uniref:hydroxymethylglutaryl-CoA lyase n=1 Tax=Cephus cinctus TaxID=211228 RepID=A0AAJ7C6H7_CEPCN|nr:hydroxymethylglutaryl-CoA lyase, mitochondrial [Cephus cinctus]XP_024944465.1 hydroxymethylglutaryl-CoA lyase, mitochondrial [Cephus cinctus]
MFSTRSITRINSTRCFNNFVRVVEVGPRDGLQNEPKVVPTSTKIDFINKLTDTGLQTIEVTSFVSPKWVPQMSDNAEVYKNITKQPGVAYPVLVPNLKGLENALNSGVQEVAIFGAASEAFSQKNINCSISESVKKFSLVVGKSKEHNVKVRGYISCIAGCPYEGDVKPLVVANLTAALLELGCYEVSLGDTIGVGTPRKIEAVLKELEHISSGNMDRFAMHCHDTYGQALANVFASLQKGIRIFDSSVAGLGGCPYAAGASGNLATEDLLYLLQGLGLETGVNLEKVVQVGDFISNELCRDNKSKVGVAMLASVKHKNYA